MHYLVKVEATMAEGEQRTIARMSWLYGQWVLQEAQAYHLPVLDVRSWDTLSESILAFIR